MERKHDMAVSQLSVTEARAIVLSLRTVLSFGEHVPPTYATLYEIAYLRNAGTKALLSVLEMT